MRKVLALALFTLLVGCSTTGTHTSATVVIVEKGDGKKHRPEVRVEFKAEKDY